MFWADALAQQLKERGKKLEWVDDMKTPSGRIHVGALMGVVIHDLIYKALKDAGIEAKYTYVFENHDPMDDIPSYLPREKYEPYLGKPLFEVPSPEPGADNYAEFYAKEFQHVFNTIGSHPEIIWTKDLYTSGKMNEGIKKVLDNVEEIRKIYEELYEKAIPKDWYPFQVYCPECGKVSTTKVTSWDGEEVTFECRVEAVDWTKGCGYEGKISPLSDETGIRGKLPWKVEWAVKWQAIGVTVEGAGKDHMSKGGSHDLASLVAKRVLGYEVPFPIAYEWMLIGGRKMSSSKGVGSAARDMLEILPPELLRFLIVKMDIKQQTNFDPGDPQTIPRLFDEYQEYAQHHFDNKGDDYARIFELSQIDDVKKPPKVSLTQLAQWVQMPNMEDKIKEEGAENWAKYARVWVERFAPEKDKFLVSDDVPESAFGLSGAQKKYLGKVSDLLTQNWTNAEDFQQALYDYGKEVGLTGKEAFAALYQALIGKNFGPRAAEFILALDHGFVKKRFEEVANS